MTEEFFRGPLTPDEIIEGAIGILEQDGWHQGDLYEWDPCKEMMKQVWAATNTGTTTTDLLGDARREAARTAPVCAMGALHRACNGMANAVGAENDAAINKAIERVDLIVRKEFGSAIPDWNDRPDTTKEDVILTFKRALHGD